MFDAGFVGNALGVVVVGVPFLLVGILGVCSLMQWRLSETRLAQVSQASILTGLAASLGMLAFMLTWGKRHLEIEIGNWVVIPGYDFDVRFLFDRLSVPFSILSYVLCGTIGAFASRYMHRESGYQRFFVLYALFLAGMVSTSLAGTIETLFAGWELVGLSSAFLVAFFQERPAPPKNGLRVWVVYRVSDAALLLAAVMVRHYSTSGNFDDLVGEGPWPAGRQVLESGPSLLIGLLLVVAAAGKSALVPFSGWLPRAMEGPTPSSAIFYGALSVHLGAFLLLRMSPILDHSLPLSALLVVLGLATAAYAYLVGAAQTDIKSALSFASLSQVGLIVAEVGLGFRYVALIHVLGHACLRTMQFIRAPTLLHDYHMLENAIGHHLPRMATWWMRLAPGRFQSWLYRLALERGYLDSLLEALFVRPFVAVFRWCDRFERRWTDSLAGRSARESDEVKPHAGSVEDLS